MIRYEKVYVAKHVVQSDNSIVEKNRARLLSSKTFSPQPGIKADFKIGFNSKFSPFEKPLISNNNIILLHMIKLDL